MKTKMGRPKLPKSKRRGILILARVSQDEHKELQVAIAKSPHSKSEWVRQALLSTARNGEQAA
jgi:hypothetical protein